MKQRKDGRFVKKVTLFDGTKKYFYSSEKTEKKARIDIDRQILEYSHVHNTEKHNFKIMAEKMLSEKEKTVSANTYESYKYSLKHLSPLYDQFIEDIQPSDIQLLINKMSLSGFSQSAIQKTKIVFGLVVDYCIIQNIPITNFTKSIKIPKTEKKKKVISIDDDGIDIINNKEKPHGMWAFILLYTGMRQGELAAIQKKDIDFTNRSINVWRSAEYTMNKAKLKSMPKSLSSIRNIPILDILFDPLVEFTNEMDNDDFIFGGSAPLTKTMLRKRWLSYCEAIGLEANQHQLRHAYAKILYRAGVDPKTAQGLLGHADIQTTMNIYTDFSRDVTEKSVSKINDFIIKRG